MLRRVYGYAAFRGPQEDIIQHVTADGDAFVLMPTGGGKTILAIQARIVADGSYPQYVRWSSSSHA